MAASSEIIQIIKDPTDPRIPLISKFIQTHNLLPSGNISMLPTFHIEKLLQAGATFVVAMLNSDIIGMIIGLDFAYETETLNDEHLIREIKLFESSPFTKKMAYSSYLCVHKDYRDRGIGSNLIETIKKRSYEIGCDFYYYMSNKDYEDSKRPIQAWYRPLNYTLAFETGFQTNLSKVKGQSFYSPSKIPFLKVTGLTSDDHQNFMEFGSDGLAFRPSLFEFERFILGLSSFKIQKGDRVLCYYSVFLNPFYVSNRQKFITIGHLAYIKFAKDLSDVDTKACLDALAFEVKNLGAHIIHGYIIGDMTPHRLIQIRGCKTPATRYLNFGGCVRVPELESISIPLF